MFVAYAGPFGLSRLEVPERLHGSGLQTGHFSLRDVSLLNARSCRHGAGLNGHPRVVLIPRTEVRSCVAGGCKPGTSVSGTYAS